MNIGYQEALATFHYALEDLKACHVALAKANVYAKVSTECATKSKEILNGMKRWKSQSTNS